MLKIEKTNNDNITKENVNEQSLCTLVIEENNPLLMFKNDSAAEKARQIFFESSTNEKLMSIASKLEALTSEYSDDKIVEVFRDIITADQQLYVDIISAMYYIVIKSGDMKFVKFMYDMCDIINEEAGIPSKVSETTEEVSESSIEEFDGDEGTK